ncbi:GNAT family N-acetyltransferase [Leifsonia sp. ZF2019]|uniref:GNAT family N-acetyltransferase n=1 Tax=Leifsonia sp. ZF2019 TaxID=2781978 RepID=UPI001CBFED35|nr:GNAT family protein [Leifsonia sp. ZF2019]UAJ80503.1 GNAT family N-acetyltransferase [Leifsonia sp. ZF2019]
MTPPPAAPVVLTGARVVLAAPVEADVDRIAELCVDPAVAEWTTVPSPYTREHAVGFVTGMVADGWITGRSCTWGIRVDGMLVGMIGLDGIADAAAEIGFWLAPAARGHGIMTEAVGLVLDFAFAAAPDGVGLERVVWHAYAGNHASAAVARRAGFVFEGISRQGAVQRGRRRDDWQAGLLADDPRTPADGWPAETWG